MILVEVVQLVADIAGNIDTVSFFNTVLRWVEFECPKLDDDDFAELDAAVRDHIGLGILTPSWKLVDQGKVHLVARFALG